MNAWFLIWGTKSHVFINQLTSKYHPHIFTTQFWGTFLHYFYKQNLKCNINIDNWEDPGPCLHPLSPLLGPGVPGPLHNYKYCLYLILVYEVNVEKVCSIGCASLLRKKKSPKSSFTCVEKTTKNLKLPTIFFVIDTILNDGYVHKVLKVPMQNLVSSSYLVSGNMYLWTTLFCY